MYLGPHIDRRFTWRKHIFGKRKQLGVSQQYIVYLEASSSSPQATDFSYEAILKPVWIYELQLWDTAPASNTEMLYA
jgi:hypothetical protein